MFVATVGMLFWVGSCKTARNLPSNPPALSEEERTEELVYVAGIDGVDWATLTHVGSLLEQHDILWCCWGSNLARGVFVPPADYERAWLILRDDSDNIGYWIELRGEERELLDIGGKDGWHERILNERYDALLQRSEYAADTALGAALREDVAIEAAQTWPHVTRILTVPRRHLSDDGQFYTGYWVKLCFSRALGDESKSSVFTCQVYYSNGHWQVGHISRTGSP